MEPTNHHEETTTTAGTPGIGGAPTVAAPTPVRTGPSKVTKPGGYMNAADLKNFNGTVVHNHIGLNGLLHRECKILGVRVTPKITSLVERSFNSAGVITLFPGTLEKAINDNNEVVLYYRDPEGDCNPTEDGRVMVTVKIFSKGSKRQRRVSTRDPPLRHVQSAKRALDTPI